MTGINTSIYQSRLLEQQSELEELDSLSNDAAGIVVLDQTSVGRLSRMDALQGQQMALETKRRRAQQLRDIKAALIRIENEDFGYCASCGNEIAVGRLAVNPAALCCVGCSN